MKMTYEGLRVDQWEKAYELAKKTGHEMDEVVENIDFFSPCYDSVEEILKELENMWLSWKEHKAKKVEDFLIEKIENEEMNVKTGFHVRFNKKTYLCTIHELNRIFGNKKVIKCKKWVYDWDGKRNIAENIFDIKIA